MPPVMKSLSAVGLFALALAAPASAQVIAQQPYPHSVTCGDFHHHKSTGTWSPKGEVQITSSAGTTSMGPGVSFAAGQIVNGYDLGKWLDTNCHYPRYW